MKVVGGSLIHAGVRVIPRPRHILTSFRVTLCFSKMVGAHVAAAPRRRGGWFISNTQSHPGPPSLSPSLSFSLPPPLSLSLSVERGSVRKGGEEGDEERKREKNREGGERKKKRKRETVDGRRFKGIRVRERERAWRSTTTLGNQRPPLATLHPSLR